MPEIPDNLPAPRQVGSIEPGEPGVLGFVDIGMLDLAFRRTQFSVMEEVDRLVSIIRDPAASYGEVLKALAHRRNMVNDVVKANSLTATETRVSTTDGVHTVRQITATRLADTMGSANERPRTQAEEAVRAGYSEPVHYTALEIPGDSDTVDTTRPQEEVKEAAPRGAGPVGEAPRTGEVALDDGR